MRENIIIKLENTKYYHNESDVKEYKNAQVERHAAKMNKRRREGAYEEISLELAPHISSANTMLCMGTRNNHERDMFRKFLDLYCISSLDIASASSADYVMDFNILPDEWTDKWDVIYSNAIDHAFSATDAFFEWLRVLKPGGYMYLDFNTSWAGIDTADCNAFTKESVLTFFNDNLDKIEIVMAGTGNRPREGGMQVIVKKKVLHEQEVKIYLNESNT